MSVKTKKVTKVNKSGINWRKVKDESYYIAVVNGVKISGQVYVEDYDEYIQLAFCNSQGIGNECASISGYTHEVNIDVYDTDNDEGTPEEQLDNEGITNITLVTDKRLIQVIDRHKIPDFNNSWSVTVRNDGEVQFGCGRVVLSLDQIKEFHRVETLKRNFEETEMYHEVVAEIDNNMYPEDVDLDEVHVLIGKAEAILAERREIGVIKPKKVKRKVKKTPKKTVKKKK